MKHETKPCMFNNTCSKEAKHTVTTKDHNYLKGYTPKYSLGLCDDHFKQLGWSANVWTKQTA